ncbi:hypothetical protein M514_00516, partial [Trichuris suis]
MFGVANFSQDYRHAHSDYHTAKAQYAHSPLLYCLHRLYETSTANCAPTALPLLNVPSLCVAEIAAILQSLPLQVCRFASAKCFTLAQLVLHVPRSAFWPKVGHSKPEENWTSGLARQEVE